jgi:hypothetical protein
MNPSCGTTNNNLGFVLPGARRRALRHPALIKMNFPRRFAATECRLRLPRKTATRRRRFPQDRTIYRWELWPPPPPELPWELGALAAPPPWYPPPPELGGAAPRLGAEEPRPG